jgi:hypothetical protein
VIGIIGEGLRALVTVAYRRLPWASVWLPGSANIDFRRSLRPRTGHTVKAAQRLLVEMGVSWAEMGGDLNCLWQVISGGRPAEPKQLNELKRLNKLNEVEESPNGVSAGRRSKLLKLARSGSQ